MCGGDVACCQITLTTVNFCRTMPPKIVGHTMVMITIPSPFHILGDVPPSTTQISPITLHLLAMA